MDTKALQFAARYSFSPNALGYCGRKGAQSAIEQCLRTGDCAALASELPHFLSQYPYLKTIATICDKDILSSEVLECYWQGNDLLKKVQNSHYDILLENFKEQGVPPWVIEDMKKRRPQTFIPTHLFQILQSGEYPPKMVNQCMIRWGKITRAGEHEADVELMSLGTQGKIEEQTTLVHIDERLVSDLSMGDIVTVHWGIVVEQTSSQSAERLAYWTQHILTDIRSRLLARDTHLSRYQNGSRAK